jgi:hypothetical protein
MSEPFRPQWRQIYEGCDFDFVAKQQLVSITAETASLALSAVRRANGEDFYHNMGAAECELSSVVEASNGVAR